MVSLDSIGSMAKEIADAFHPERIILFGSYASGTASDDSDVDLLIIGNDRRPKPQRSAPIYSFLRNYPFSKDIIVHTPQEVEDYKGFPSSLIHHALEEGIVLYERQA